MNSRERVLVALNHQEPDRVPYDLGGVAQTGVHTVAYFKLRHYLGLPAQEVKARQLFSQEAELHEDFLESLNVDTRYLPRRSTLGERYEQREEGNYRVCTDQWGIVYRMPRENGLYYDVWLSPFDVDDVKERLKTYLWPDPIDPWHYEGLRERARKARDKGKLVVLQGFTAGIVETYAWLRGYNHFFLDLGLDQPTASYFLDKLVEIKSMYWKQALTELGDLVDVVNEGDDLASQQSLLMSPDTYRDLIKPRHKKLFEAIKQAAPHVKIFMHSCGAVRPLIPDLIEAGIDILNPIQLGARGMDPLEIKREFGRDLSLWGGGIDAQGVLGSGTPAGIREHVLRNLEIFAPGGGYVFAADHVVQSDVPPENFVAMWETLQKYN